MNLIRIKNIAEKKKISIRQIALKIDMSEQNLHKCIKDNRIEAEYIEPIAQILGVPVNYFFDEEINPILLQEPTATYKTVPKIKCTNCERLEKLLDSQERIINRLETDLESCRGVLEKKDAS